jgi:hypothetical protein
MLKKSFLYILLITLVGGAPLGERAYASCGPCTAEQKKTCTDVKISYVDLKGITQPGWTAEMWYTPCGEKSENSLVAEDWHTTYSCCVQKGTKARMRQEWVGHDLVDIDATKPELNIACMGFEQNSETADDPCCRDTSIPLPPTTKVIVNYDPDVKWLGIIHYTPPQKCAESSEIRDNIVNPSNTFTIKSGTHVGIGPLFLPDLVSENMSGAEVKVQCSGHLVGDASCCVVGRLNCPPKPNKSGN